MVKSKMKWLLPAALTIALGSLSLTACSDSGSAGPSDTPTNALGADCPDPNGTLATAAKAEGSVVLMGPSLPQVQDQLPTAFENTYGIPITYDAASGSQHAAKLTSERAAGIYSTDVYLGGLTDLANTFTPNNWLAPLKPVLSSDVLKTSNWIGNQVPWADPTDSTMLTLSNNAYPAFYYNTSAIKDGQITSWKDLTDPQYKGKIVIDNPTGSGAGLYFYSMIKQAYGEDVAKSIFVDQNPVYATDAGQEVDGVAKGTYEIGIATSPSSVQSAIDDGLPVKFAQNVQGPLVVASGFGIEAMLDKAPHPNSAQLLVNWLACSTGNTVWNDAMAYASTRSDVPPQPDVAAYAEIPSGAKTFNATSWDYATTTRAADGAELKKLNAAAGR
jgi:iron(III) transport system substrate-binding protein